MYLIEDTIENRKLRRKRITIHDYEDGHIELYNGARPLSFRLFYDKISVVDPGAIVSNKRLGSVLEMIKTMQEAKPQPLRSVRAPSHSHIGIPHATVIKRKMNKVSSV
jgi:hypothetical protein